MTLQIQSCNELRLLRNDHRCMQWITAAAAPSCGQKKHTRWPRHTLRPTTYILGLLGGSQFSDSADTVMQRITTASKRSLAMNYRYMQWITAAAAPSCGQKKHTRWPRHVHAMNSTTYILGLLGGSQFSDSADTVMQRITPAAKRSLAMNYRCCCVLVHAMNYSYCCAIVRSEKTHTLAK